MKIENKIDSSSYGLCLLSVSQLTEFLKENKVRKKSLIDFFNVNESLSNKSLSQGAVLPLNLQLFNQFYFDIYEQGDSPLFGEAEWGQCLHKRSFRLQVEAEDVYLCGMDVLNDWRPKRFEQPVLGYVIGKGGGATTRCFYYEAQQVLVAKGCYLVDVRGYKRRKPTGDSDEDYGIAFELKRVESFAEAPPVPESILFQFSDLD